MAFKRKRHFSVAGSFFSLPQTIVNHISNASVVQFRDNKYRRTGSELLEGKKVIENGARGWVGLQKFTKRDSFQGNARQSGFSNFTFHGNYEVARGFSFSILVTPARSFSLPSDRERVRALLVTQFVR